MSKLCGNGSETFSEKLMKLTIPMTIVQMKRRLLSGLVAPGSKRRQRQKEKPLLLQLKAAESDLSITIFSQI